MQAIKTRGGHYAVRHWGIYWTMNKLFTMTWGILLVKYGPLIDVTGTPEGNAAIAEHQQYEAERKALKEQWEKDNPGWLEDQKRYADLVDSSTEY